MFLEEYSSVGQLDLTSLINFKSLITIGIIAGLIILASTRSE